MLVGSPAKGQGEPPKSIAIVPTERTSIISVVELTVINALAARKAPALGSPALTPSRRPLLL